MKKKFINEIKQLQKIAGLLKEDEFDFSDNPLRTKSDKHLTKYPFVNSDIFLSDEYLAKLDALVKSQVVDKGGSMRLMRAVNTYVDVLESGWRTYDDYFYDGEFDGDVADVHILGAGYVEDGEERTYLESKNQLDELVPGLSDEIYDLFMEGKAEYYEQGSDDEEEED